MSMICHISVHNMLGLPPEKKPLNENRQILKPHTPNTLPEHHTPNPHNLFQLIHKTGTNTAGARSTQRYTF